MTSTHHYKAVMNVLLRTECHFVMLGCGSLDEGNCLKSVMMVSLVTPGTLGTPRMQSPVTRASRMWPAGSWLPGTPAIHESCRELTRTRRGHRQLQQICRLQRIHRATGGIFQHSFGLPGYNISCCVWGYQLSVGRA